MIFCHHALGLNIDRVYITFLIHSHRSFLLCLQLLNCHFDKELEMPTITDFINSNFF